MCAEAVLSFQVLFTWKSGDLLCSIPHFFFFWLTFRAFTQNLGSFFYGWKFAQLEWWAFKVDCLLVFVFPYYLCVFYIGVKKIHLPWAESFWLAFHEGRDLESGVNVQGFNLTPVSVMPSTEVRASRCLHSHVPQSCAAVCWDCRTEHFT